MIWPLSLLFPKRKPVVKRAVRHSVPPYRRNRVPFVAGGLDGESIVEAVEAVTEWDGPDHQPPRKDVSADEEEVRNRHSRDFNKVADADLPLEKPHDHSRCTTHSHDYGSTTHTHSHSHSHSEPHTHTHETHNHESHSCHSEPSGDCGGGDAGGSTND